MCKGKIDREMREGKTEKEIYRKVAITKALRFLAFFALLKIMVTYISFNEGSQWFLLPSLCARSFVFLVRGKGERGTETMDVLANGRKE